jgi:hypothetical protein
MTIRIHLTPKARNQIKLKIGNDNRNVFDVDPDQEIVWTIHDGSKNDIARWVVSFLEEGTPGGCDGSPLARTQGGSPEYQIRGKDRDVQTYVVGAAAKCYRFGVAVLGTDGELYALDPEIRVRGDGPPAKEKGKKKG